MNALITWLNNRHASVRMAGVALAYLAIGSLTFKLSNLTSTPSFIWLPTGLAFIALLVWGTRTWPGVWMGAFGTALLFGESQHGPLLAAIIATSTTLQTWLSIATTRRYFNLKSPSTSDLDLLRSLVYAGPLSCLLSATTVAMARLWIDQIDLDDVLAEWVLWWGADSLGIILGAPMLLALWPSAQPDQSQRITRKVLFIPLTAIASLVFAGNFAFTQLEKDRTELVAKQALLDATLPSLRHAMETLNALRPMAQLFSTSRIIHRTEFNEFSKLLSENAAVQSIDWTPKITHEEREVFEVSLHQYMGGERKIAEKNSDAHLSDRPPSPVYFPIWYTYPSLNEAKMMGFDHASDLLRRSAMISSVLDPKQTILKIDLLPRTQKPALLVFLPTFTQQDIAPVPADKTTPLHQDVLRGFIIGIFDLNHLFKDVVEAAQDKNALIRITDITNASAPSSLMTNFSNADTHPDKSQKFTSKGVTWQMELAFLSPAWKAGHSDGAKLYLAFSLFAALAAVYATLGSVGRNATAVNKLAQRRKELENELSARKQAETALEVSENRYRNLINSSPLATLVHYDGEILFLNPAAVKLFNAANENTLIGRSLLKLIAPEDRQMIIDRRKMKRVNDQFSRTEECTCLRVDGTRVAVAFASTPYEFDGKKTSLIIIQDISEQKDRKDLVGRFFEMSTDLLCIVSRDGHFQRINHAFTHTLGWSAEDMATRKLLELVHPDDLAASIEVVKQLNSRVTISGYENRFMCKDGSTRRLEWMALTQPDGLIFASARDCTERHEIAVKLQKLNTELAQRFDERSAALKALHAKEQEVRAVLDNLLECVMTINVEGLIQTVNPALERTLGFTPDEVIGKNISTLMAPSYKSKHEFFVKNFLHSGYQGFIDRGREVSGLHKNGHEVPLALSLSEYLTAGKRYFLVTLQDISITKQLIRDLTQAREDAEQASRAKSAFLASMSHEIRTPMNGVIGLVDVLNHGGLTDQQEDLVQTIKESSTTLLRIIDDILDFSKIEAGNMQLESAPVSLLNLAEGVGNTLLSVALRGKVDIHLYVSPDLPDVIMSDEVRLHQVLYNLIGNAIKFSSSLPDRTGKVTLRITRNPDNHDEMCVAISDNGIGIAEDKLKVIFNPFTQAEASTTRKYGGTGLGLTITLKLIQMMQGRIDVESTLGQGTHFQITLPIRPGPVTQAVDAHPTLEGVQCVSVVGQHEWAKDVIAYLLEQMCIVKTFDDSNGALEYLKTHAMPLVLLNFASHGANDLEALTALTPPSVSCVSFIQGRRRHARIKDARTVMIDMNAMRKAALVKAVGIASGRVTPNTSNQPYHSRKLPEPTPEVPEHPQHPGVTILVAEDDLINQKVILQQLTCLGYAAEFAKNGEEALRMWQVGAYALLLTDMHMPLMDGYTLTRKIREIEGAQKHLPIIALTANALKGEEQEALAAGMDAYLTKPIRLEILRSTLQKWIPASKTPEASTPKPGVMDIEVLKRLVGDNESVISGILGDFLSLTGQYANELHSAFDNSDLPACAGCVHKLKSAARSVGALELGDLCEAIESHAKHKDRTSVQTTLPQFNLLLSKVHAAIQNELNHRLNTGAGEKS